jgi:hypothetical protein
MHHPRSPRKKKLKKSPSAGKVMITVSGTLKGILVDAMPRGETVNSDAYIRTLTGLSVSNKFGLTRIQQTSCFSMAM